MGFVSNIVGGILGAGAAGDAADALQAGAKQAENTIQSNQNAANNFQQGVWSGTQSAEQPFQSLGSTSANHLRDLVTGGFQAPTVAEAEASPGFQFQLEQGTNAINQNAAATGTLLSGNTGVALQKYGQGLAETTYNDAYQRALQSYLANYQTLMGGTQAGLTSTGQLGTFGQEAARNTSSIDLSSADMLAKQYNNAAAARAQGIMTQAADWGKVAGGIIDAGTSLAGGFGNLDTTGGSSFGEQLQNFYQGMGG